MKENPVAKLPFAVILSLFFLFSGELSIVLAQETREPVSSLPASPFDLEQKAGSLSLSWAAMCEKIDNLLPINKAITFPVSTGQVYCLTSFDAVPREMLVYHRWYHMDDLNTQVRLRIHPPQWTTFSTMQLRETDKGPWRVEVTDENGRILTVLRFSITD
jgi:hypothetical protein